MVTNASPEDLVGRILAHASRLLTEFNKYEALEMLETLKIRLRTPNVTSVALLARLPNG